MNNGSEFFSKLKYFFWKYDIYLICCFAFAIRIFQINSSFFGSTDELFRDLGVVYNFVHTHNFLLYGPSSSLGFNFGGIYYYFLLPLVYLFKFQPVGAILTSTFFSILTLIVFFTLLKEWFGDRRVALLGAFLLAVTTYDIQNAYSISNPNLMPFFTVSLFYLFTLFLSDKLNWFYAILMGAGLGIEVQLHGTALFILPLIVLLLFSLKKTGFLRLIPYIFFGAIVTQIPNILIEANNHFMNLHKMFAAGGGSIGWVPNLNMIEPYLKFWYGFFLFSNEAFDLFARNPIAFFLIAAANFIFCGIFLYHIFKRNFSYGIDILPAGKKIMAIWIGIGTVVFLFFQKPYYSFYFKFFWPLPLIIFLWFLLWIKANDKLLYRLLLGLFFLAQAVQLSFFFPFIHHPEFTPKAYLNAQSEIQRDARGAEYAVFCRISYCAPFSYYDQLFGIPYSSANPKFVYLIYDNPGQIKIPYPGIKIGVVADKNYYIEKY